MAARAKKTNKKDSGDRLVLALILLSLAFLSISIFDPSIITFAVVEEIPEMNQYFPLVLTGIFFLAAMIIYRRSHY
ncbi:hypothetical protein CMO89_01825 [Candidatus Woesearchaeota archaeon]|nr:hypothetical protein [Candidatus Woesearchaeota archaeon]|tara:strand:- start:1795 stop:2022 length:228 start_codon:yes stop_codon:yes gene_type:complete